MQYEINIKATINPTGLVYRAILISPCKNIMTALVVPHPEHGMPKSALNGHIQRIKIDQLTH